MPVLDNHLIMVMAHNAYWCQLERRYTNFKVSVFGSGSAYARMREEDIPKDCDFVILDGSETYRNDEFWWIKEMGMRTSADNNKRVSIGYVYFIPRDERPDSSLSCEIKVASFKNGDCYEETVPISSYDLLTLAGIIVKTHNELGRQKTLQMTEVTAY